MCAYLLFQMPTSNYRNTSKRSSVQVQGTVAPRVFHLPVHRPSALASQLLTTHPLLFQPSIIPPQLRYSPIPQPTSLLRNSPSELCSLRRALKTTMHSMILPWVVLRQSNNTSPHPIIIYESYTTWSGVKCSNLRNYSVADDHPQVYRSHDFFISVFLLSLVSSNVIKA